MHGVCLKAMLVLFYLVNLAYAGEPLMEPILRINIVEHTEAINRIASNEVGRYLVTTSNDKTAKVWDLIDGRLITTLRIPIGTGHEGKLMGVALSPDGQTVALGGYSQLGFEGKGNHNIFLFDLATGRIKLRLTGLSNTVISLAFSPDGRSLAATLGSDGMRLFSVSDGSLIGEDRDYAGSSYSAHFSHDGRLVTTSWDGYLRLYRCTGQTLTLLTKRAAPGGKKPYAARFSPDDTRIAVGFDDTPAVNVLDSADLGLDYAPKTMGVDAGMASVTWSRDGTMLYAAGKARKQFNIVREFYIRRWTNSGRGAAQDYPVAGSTLMDLFALPEGRLAFGGATPSWGVIDEQGKRTLFHGSQLTDFRDNVGGFTLSANGSQVHFGHDPAVFDILNRAFAAPDTLGLNLPKSELPEVKFLMDPAEEIRCQALSADGFIIGANFYLYAFDRSGQRHWRQPAPGVVEGVNVSQDGRWVVAAYHDGTIRWHRASDGVEQLAFFPHADKKRWIMWTPEGYYDASPGGEDLIGWHLNQGKDKEARFIPGGQFYDVFFRPDIVQAKFRGDDISSMITITAAQSLKNPPPILRFTQVPSASKNNSEKVCYKVISTGGGIGEVRLFQNGKLVKSDGFYRETINNKNDEKFKLAIQNSATIQRGLRNLKVTQIAPSPIASTDKGKEFEACEELETLPGENEISVAAFNAPNTVQSTLETVSYKVDRKVEDPHLYVLGVGIDHYTDPSNDLEYAAKDAKDFRAMMQEKAGSLYKPENIHIEGLSDKAANKEGIQKAIQSLSAKVKPWDSFIFFVASHGVLLENQYFIVTSGYDGTMNKANFISSNEIIWMSKSIKSLSQLFIFDTCHAGGVDNLISGLYDARMSVMAKKMGLHIYASAGSTQTAMDGYQGNGLFTHTLLKSMRDGKVTDTNHDNQVSVMELGEQARQETFDISKRLGYPQSPNIINFGKDTMLFRVP